MKELVKKLGYVAATAAVTTLTSCIVKSTYEKYKGNEVAKKQLKNKIKKLNPFKKFH